ncbi:hypothetical protein VNO77_46933 [Canavalia gladiata]|uniref:Uncharacterized protein n=1 Tax=Canavalia gladiata TaxID=3824 RepID=A0AAN9PIL8_CANGL
MCLVVDQRKAWDFNALFPFEPCLSEKRSFSYPLLEGQTTRVTFSYIRETAKGNFFNYGNSWSQLNKRKRIYPSCVAGNLKEASFPTKDSRFAALDRVSCVCYVSCATTQFHLAFPFLLIFPLSCYASLYSPFGPRLLSCLDITGTFTGFVLLYKEFPIESELKEWAGSGCDRPLPYQ